ncbi:MAG: type I-F CRISPR-associated protein Csy3 [bacterium]
MAKALTIPALLNYTRSIIPSNGVFYYQRHHTDNRTNEQPTTQTHPILINRQTVRGTIANYGNVYSKGKQAKDSDLAKKLDPANANIQTVDMCYLPDDIDTFFLRFSLSITNHTAAPGACNAADYRQHLVDFFEGYREKQGFDELAQRYLQNLINARWLWRNRYAAEKTVEIIDQAEPDTPYRFQPAYDLEADYQACEGYDTLKQKIAQALSGESPVLRLSIIGRGTLGYGQEVYPSQEFVDNKKEGKVLASIETTDGKRQAIMHSQKIGNAIRTIDDWHGHAATYGKIAAEPYGVVPSRSEAIRLPNSKNDLYSHLKKLDAINAEMRQATQGKLPDAAHYVMACLVRGGVYSGEGKTG